MIAEVTEQLQILSELRAQVLVKGDSANGGSEGPLSTNGTNPAPKEEPNGNPS
jgi:hypothetical protein